MSRHTNSARMVCAFFISIVFFLSFFSGKLHTVKFREYAPSCISPSKYKPPQTGTAKKPPLNRLSKYKPPPPPLGKLPSNTKYNKAKMVKYKPRGLFSEFYGISAKASDVSTKPNSSEKPVKGPVRVS